MLRHLMLRLDVGSGKSLAYSAWANEMPMLRRLRLGRKPGGKARSLPIGYQTRSCMVGWSERKWTCRLSMWVGPPAVRVSLRCLRRGSGNWRGAGNSMGMSRCSRSGLRDNKCSRWGELRGVGDLFWAEEAEGGEVGKSPCLVVGKQAK
jgi:hypothetical protein